jgi:hypothetical protein
MLATVAVFIDEVSVYYACEGTTVHEALKELDELFGFNGVGLRRKGTTGLRARLSRNTGLQAGVAYEYILLEVDKMVHIARQEEMKRMEERTKQAEAATEMAVTFAKKAAAELIEAQAKADIAVYRKKRLVAINNRDDTHCAEERADGKVRFLDSSAPIVTDPFSDLLRLTDPSLPPLPPLAQSHQDNGAVPAQDAPLPQLCQTTAGDCSVCP